MASTSVLILLLRLICAYAFIVRSTNNNRIISQDASSQDALSSSWDEGGVVSVRIEKQIGNRNNSTIISPSDAVDVWLEQHWNKGGGLPIVILTNDEERKRTILPVGMEETYVFPEYSEEDVEGSVPASISYTVTNAGPFSAGLVPNSHRGNVRFLKQSTGLQMIWEVDFETTKYRSLYQTVTEFTIGVASRTVAEALGPSRLMTVQATVEVPSSESDSNSNSTASPAEQVRREWLEFFWARGGGLPLPPPIPYGEVLEEGGGRARKSILRIPPLLIDTVLSTSNSTERAELVYEIQRPGWITFPFLIHTHLGRVQFVASSDSNTDDNTCSVGMLWEIEVRPFPLVSFLVEKLLEMTATTIVRNLAVHLTEPDAKVVLQPPRGKTIEVGDTTISSFGSISKATWLGGVLDEHLQDRRSTWDQTLSLLQPLTWGRSKDAGSEDDNVSVRWRTGSIEL